jgi:hypothetical protein
MGREAEREVDFLARGFRREFSFPDRPRQALLHVLVIGVGLDTEIGYEDEAPAFRGNDRRLVDWRISSILRNFPEGGADPSPEGAASG